MIVRIDPLANVVQQRREQKVFIVRQLVARSIEHLQAVIEGVPFRMVLQILFDVLEREQQRLVDLEPIDLLARFVERILDVQIRVLVRQELL